jgi:hypothetical protein
MARQSAEGEAPVIERSDRPTNERKQVMAEKSYQVGDLVVLASGEWQGYPGVVSWPISQGEAGYVLVCSEGRIAGLRCSYQEVKPADETGKGFVQVAYHLNKLSSHLIEKAILNLAGIPDTR